MRWILLVVLAGCTPAANHVPRERPVDPQVSIPGGTFRMGSPAAEPGRYPDEGPVTVEVAPFRIDRHEVTAAAFAERAEEIRALDPAATFVSEAETPAGWPGRCNVGSNRADHPATCVTFRAARAYCRLLGGDLPTEAEWERAARGDGGSAYFWGDSFDPGRAISSVACGRRGCAGSSQPVASAGLRCNAAGVCDLTGNAWEWTASDYREQLGPEAAVPASEPELPVIRGGGWVDDDPAVLRTALRGQVYPEHGLTAVGFRCVSR